MIFNPVVSIPKPVWRRVQMLVGELSYMQDGEEIRGIDLDMQCEDFVRRIVDEYVRQYFEESTRSAAQLVHKRQLERERRLL